MGLAIPSRFLRRLQKTAGFGTTTVVGKAVIRQAFIRQMPVLIRAYLATQPDSASLGNLAVLADHALASENDVEELKAEIQVSESAKLVGLLEDLSRRLKKLETVTARAKMKSYGHKQTPENRVSKTPLAPNAQAKPFIPYNQNDNRLGFFTNVQQANRPNVSPRIHSRIVLFNRSTQPMHLSAIIIKHSVIKPARAETPARFL